MYRKIAKSCPECAPFCDYRLDETDLVFRGEIKGFCYCGWRYAEYTKSRYHIYRKIDRTGYWHIKKGKLKMPPTFNPEIWSLISLNGNIIVSPGRTIMIHEIIWKEDGSYEVKYSEILDKNFGMPWYKFITIVEDVNNLGSILLKKEKSYVSYSIKYGKINNITVNPNEFDAVVLLSDDDQLACYRHYVGIAIHDIYNDIVLRIIPLTIRLANIHSSGNYLTAEIKHSSLHRNKLQRSSLIAIPVTELAFAKEEEHAAMYASEVVERYSAKLNRANEEIFDDILDESELDEPDSPISYNCCLVWLVLRCFLAEDARITALAIRNKS